VEAIVQSGLSLLRLAAAQGDTDVPVPVSSEAILSSKFMPHHSRHKIPDTESLSSASYEVGTALKEMRARVYVVAGRRNAVVGARSGGGAKEEEGVVVAGLAD
jgi:hypothetical protein